MRILLIDCQILQTAAFHRGMGKYTTRLLSELVRLNSQKNIYDQLTAVLNSNLEDRAEYIKQEIGLRNFEYTNIPTDISQSTLDKYRTAEKEVTSLAKKFTNGGTTVDYLVTAPFFVDFPAVFPDLPEVGKYSIVYDLIPYKIWHLQRIFPDELYAQHFELFIKADHLFTISTAVKNDLVNLLGLNEKNITSIDGGPFMDPTQITGSTTTPINLEKPYILFPSAPIVHKNNDRAVEGFEKFNRQHDQKYTLYITSSFGEEEQVRLKRISPRLEFTGNISDEDLVGAYKGADVVLFASLAEGLGMPVLESIACGVPAACSDIDVLTEIAADGFYAFDPLSSDSIANALSDAASHKDWENKRKVHEEIKKKYNWENSASVLLSKLASTSPVAADGKDGGITLASADSPAEGTPIGRLAEFIYAPLKQAYGEVKLLVPPVEPAFPSYAAYIVSSRRNTAVKVELSSKRSLNPFSKAKGISINLESDGNKHSLHLTAIPAVYDRALGMNSWQYFDDNVEMKPQDLVKWISDNEKGDRS